MGFIRLLAWFLLIGSIFAVAALALWSYGNIQDTGKSWKKYRWTIGVPLVMLIIVFIVSGIGQVEAGQRGVVTQFGAVTGEIKGEGIYFVIPGIQKVIPMDIQTNAYNTEAAAVSSDLQDVMTSITVNYNLNPNMAATVYQTIGKDYVERIIRPAVQESVKSVTAQFNAEGLIIKRPEVGSKIRQVLSDRLAPLGINVDAISTTNFQFSPEFTNSIEAKAVAAQKALEAENKLREIEVVARQAEAEAKGQAAAKIAQSEGESQSILNVAKAQAEANKLITESITPELVQYNLVTKLSPNIKVMILPSGQSFILDPAALLGSE
jgi:prohibitin 2